MCRSVHRKLYLFTVHCKLDRKTLHIAFVDFKEAFDQVRHKDVLYKLLKCGISSKFYGIIKSMYTNIRLTVHSCDGQSMTLYFISLLGVRKGDNLSSNPV